jgi:hypothetical protein
MKRTLLMRPILMIVVLLLSVGGAVESVRAEDVPLPERTGARPQTTPGVPHVQIGVRSFAEVNAALLRRVATLPGVEVRPTVVSLPGAKGFWLTARVALAHPEVIVGGREFAHMHPDGSLHASLAPGRARDAGCAGWATAHPWANQRAGWEGFVMLYTPQTMAELEVTFQLVVDSYNFVTGRDVLAADHGAGR